jgi:ATP-binding cassette subfamily F protein 3
LESAYRNQRLQIEHLEAFINRFRAQATKAKQVQSRIKELEKIERIEIPEDEPVIHFKFPQPPSSGRIVVEAEGLSKSYGSKQVLNNVKFSIERGDRVALVGVNGAGKSTLIRLLTGDEAPTAGSVHLGHNVVSEYFAQDQYKVLDGESRMLDDISRAALKVPEQALRALLGCFLFSGDDVFKPLGVLSGGERNRYALARILVSPSNFLLLDEPTNHLDMRAKDVLLDALAAFSGTVVFVSHDRYFIDRLATRVLEVEGGTVTCHEGNYEDYLRWKEAQAVGASASEPATRTKPPELPANGTHHASDEADSATPERSRRLNPIKQKQMEERCVFLEEEIPRMEAAIAHTEEQLGVYVSAAETQRLSTLAQQLREQLAAFTAEWEELMMQLEGA